METSKIIEEFRKFTSEFVNREIENCAPDQLTLTYFEMHFFDFLSILQVQSSALLDSYSAQSTKQEFDKLARILQTEVEAALNLLKERFNIN